MQNRRFEDLGARLRGAQTQPAQRDVDEGRRAVRFAHDAELRQIAVWLRSGQPVLVECGKTLANFIVAALRDPDNEGMELLPAMRWQDVTCRPPQPANGVMSQLLTVAATELTAGAPDRVVLLRHLDLMTCTPDDRPQPQANDLVFWLSESSGVRLAFWDPMFTLPKVLEAAFPNRISIQAFDREHLWELVLDAEARLFSGVEGFSVAAQSRLYQYVSGANVVELRRILRALVGQGFIGNVGGMDKVYEHIRRQMGLPPMVKQGDVAGYEALRQQLKREVLFPVKLRQLARNEREVRQADALVPRGVLLYGPPGNGKTEWAKWLAVELNTPLFVIHGPELKNRYVGETEAAIRRIFAQARRCAPSVILIDEIDSMAPARDAMASNFESSMVAQLLSEMDGMRREESVIVVATTNRRDKIDEAFLRPGRFSRQILVDYPERADQERILEFYAGDEQMALGLSAQAVNGLVNIIAQSGRRFSGDHLREVCRHLLLDMREGELAPETLTPEHWVKAVGAVAGASPFDGHHGPGWRDAAFGR